MLKAENYIYKYNVMLHETKDYYIFLKQYNYFQRHILDIELREIVII